MTEITTLPARSEIPLEQTWDLESVYASPADWEEACQQLSHLLPRIAAYQGRLAEGPQTILEYLDLAQEAGILAGKIRTYAFNKSAVDTTDQGAVARAGQSSTLLSRFFAAVAFADPELMAVGFDRLWGWIDQTPELTFFAHYVHQLQKHQAHVRSSEVEQVLAMTSDPFTGPWSVYSMLNNADLTFEPAVASDGTEIEVGQASISSLHTHPDRQVRRTAWENYADGYLAFKNTYAAALTAALKQDVFNARARGYETSLHASVESNDIPVQVFHNLIETFKKNLPTWHRYWRLRKRALGYESFHVYDIKAPLTPAKPEVPYRQAVDWIAEGMAPLGQEYVGVLRQGCLENRWVDRAGNKGKREGAFSSGSYGTRPFILMSYADDLFSLSTLAHELGHSLHSYYTRANQPFIYSRYSLFVAEVASNFNQAMVRDYLFRTQADRDFQIALIEEAMSNYHRYFFIMPTLARFELEMHTRAEQGAPLSAEVMTAVTADLFKEGYGDEVVFDRDRIGITWAQFGHMYMNFYVYQYATGISGAHALSHAILSGEPGAAGRYLDFLKAGGSLYPLEALSKAGVDLESSEPVERAFEVLAGLVDRLENLLA
ncbi:MAG TPA: oligoendopeptidase F [Anaerolineales bacterium]|nr:oligoendopeptidase F [Anaerolineales bacterium]